MAQRDYVIRLIEQFIRMLHVIMGVAGARKFPEALQLIDEAFQRFFGWDSRFINSMPLDYLLDRLQTSGHLDADHCLIMAELLKAEGDIYLEQEMLAESFHRHTRALALFIEVYRRDIGEIPLDFLAHLEETIELVSPFELPESLNVALFPYYEASGALARAEDLLYAMLEEDSEGHWLARGIDFYERLLTLPDAILEAGNLPRAEVAHALDELRQRSRT